MVNDYWKKRIEAEQKARIERDATLGQEMKRLYDYHFSELEKEIRVFEQRYADKNNIPLSEVKARVSDMDVRAFEEKAKRYVAEKNFSAKANAELSLYNLKMKTSRLELLQYQMDLELLALSNGEHQLTEKFLNEEYIKELDVQAGLLGRSVLSASQIAQVAQTTINTPFKGAVWSDKIWQRQSALREIVARVTEDYLLKGKNPTAMITQIRREFDVSANQAKRLAVTEGARVATEAQKQAFSANGYDEYEFIAEPGACGLCKPLDGKIFKVKDMEPGLNASPVHPFCRCATAAHFSMSDEEYERLIRESAESVSGGSAKKLENEVQERRVSYGKNEIFDRKFANSLKEITTRKVLGVDYPRLYVSDQMRGRKMVSKFIDSQLNDVLGQIGDRYDLTGLELPKVVIVDKTESKEGVLAGYIRRSNTLFVRGDLKTNELIVKEQTKGSPGWLVGENNPNATLIHELGHWYQFQDAKRRFPKLSDQELVEILRQESRDLVAKLIKEGYNIKKELSGYAAQKAFDIPEEVFAELFTKQILFQ